MTDFLSGLLDRTLQRRPVLQRRQPALFEPTPDPPGLRSIPLEEPSARTEAQTDADLEATVFREIPMHHSRRPQIGHVMPARPNSPASEDQTGESFRTPPPVVPSERQSVRQARQVASPSLPPPHQHTAKVVVPVVSHRAVETLGEVETSREVETLREKATEAPQVAVQAVFPQAQNREPLSVDASLDAPPRQTLVTPIVELAQTMETAGRRDVVRKSDATLMEPKPTGFPVPPAPVPSPPLGHASSRPQPVPTQETTAPAPTIQVTIGRIEIRATPAAAPARAVRPAAPKLSLEEYLRSRGGGNS